MNWLLDNSDDSEPEPTPAPPPPNMRQPVDSPTFERWTPAPKPSAPRRPARLEGSEYHLPALHNIPFQEARVPYDIPNASPPAQIPANMNQYLRAYQREGVAWMYRRFCDNTGGLLGDDMGLGGGPTHPLLVLTEVDAGKTVQSIVFLALVFAKAGDSTDAIPSGMPPALIVVPASLMEQWDKEIGRWCEFRVMQFKAKVAEEVFECVERRQVEIVICTYETLRSEQHGPELWKISWTLVICDEAHRLKNDKSKTVAAARGFNTSRRFGLTGTPVQNNFKELWTLLDWCCPGSLGSADEFKKEFTNPIDRGQSTNASKEAIALKNQKCAELRSLADAHILARSKVLIADQLPGKQDLVVLCRMSDLQLKVYNHCLHTAEFELLRLARSPCDCGMATNTPCEHNPPCAYAPVCERSKCHCLKYRVAPGGAIWDRLHPLSDHPAEPHPADPQGRRCFYTDRESPRYVKGGQKRLGSKPHGRAGCSGCDDAIAEVGGAYLSDQFIAASDPKNCGKLLALIKLLKQFHDEGAKVLVFSQSVQMLDILSRFMSRRGYEFRRLDGGVPTQKRDAIVTEFNARSDIFVFLISTRVGGLGLNLTSASKVVIFDPMWNPTFDLQAQDRAFRLGQQTFVTVYRLLSQGSIEESIYKRQVYKQQRRNLGLADTNERRYFQAVEKEDEGELFGVSNLLKLPKDVIGMHDILQKREVLEAEFTKTDGMHIQTYVPPAPSEADTEGSEGGGGNQDANGLIYVLNETHGVGSHRGGWKRKGDALTRNDGDLGNANLMLADCGVASVHENTNIIGDSAVESEINRRAGKGNARTQKRRHSQRVPNKADGVMYDLVAKKAMHRMSMDRVEFADWVLQADDDDIKSVLSAALPATKPSFPPPASACIRPIDPDGVPILNAAHTSSTQDQAPARSHLNAQARAMVAAPTPASNAARPMVVASTPASNAAPTPASNAAPTPASNAARPMVAASTPALNDRIRNPVVILLVGPPGVGKTTFRKKLLQQVQEHGGGLAAIEVVCQDEEGTKHKCERKMNRALERRCSVIVDRSNALKLDRCSAKCLDRTNCDEMQRGTWITIARKYSAQVIAVKFDVPEAVCLDRVSRRLPGSHPTLDGKIQEQNRVVQYFFKSLVPPTKKEGIDLILDAEQEENSVNLARRLIAT